MQRELEALFAFSSLGYSACTRCRLPIFRPPGLALLNATAGGVWLTKGMSLLNMSWIYCGR